VKTLTHAFAMLAALAVVCGAPAAAHASDCTDSPVAHTFLRWVDPAWYGPLPDGGLEHGGSGWTLSRGAAAVEGNEPFDVSAASDDRSLALPDGSAATSPAVCVGVEHPTIRLFARNTGSPASVLSVSVVFTGLDGNPISLPVGQLTSGARWAPTPVVAVGVNLLSLLGSQRVAFRFAPLDSSGDWQIDDVYLDPYGKR
jgi:hypothetical protein